MFELKLSKSFFSNTIRFLFFDHHHQCDVKTNMYEQKWSRKKAVIFKKKKNSFLFLYQLSIHKTHTHIQTKTQTPQTLYQNHSQHEIMFCSNHWLIFFRINQVQKNELKKNPPSWFIPYYALSSLSSKKYDFISNVKSLGSLFFFVGWWLLICRYQNNHHHHHRQCCQSKLWLDLFLIFGKFFSGETIKSIPRHQSIIEIKIEMIIIWLLQKPNAVKQNRMMMIMHVRTIYRPDKWWCWWLVGWLVFWIPMDDDMMMWVRVFFFIQRYILWILFFLY